MDKLNWLDIAVILILLLFMIEGLLRGFVSSFFNTIGVIAAFLAARFLSPYLGDYISKNTYIYSKIYGYCNQKIPDNAAASYVFKLIGGGESIGGTIANGLILMVSFAVVFMLGRVIIYAFSSVFNVASKLPVLKQFNRLGGLVFGLFKGALILYVIFAVLTPVLPLLKPSNPLVAALNQSYFAINFYRYNIIITLLNGSAL